MTVEVERLGEAQARQLLERAAALDAKLSSEIGIAQLREAAAAAGISAEAFEQALREDAEADSDVSGASGSARGSGVLTAPGAAEAAHYAGLLRDLLGEDAQIVVVEDRIEGHDDDGITISINPSSGEAAASVAAVGSLRRRLLAIALPIIVPITFAVFLGMEEEDAAIGVFVGALLAVFGAMIATAVSNGRERKELRRKAERIRRQLQRMMGAGPDRG